MSAGCCGFPVIEEGKCVKCGAPQLSGRTKEAKWALYEPSARQISEAFEATLDRSDVLRFHYSVADVRTVVTMWRAGVIEALSDPLGYVSGAQPPDIPPIDEDDEDDYPAL